MSIPFKHSTYLLFVVGDDTTYEVRAGVVQGLHEALQLLLVELTHRAEHALPGAGSERRLVGLSRAHANNLSG